jgi:hypothetical protein
MAALLGLVFLASAAMNTGCAASKHSKATVTECQPLPRGTLSSEFLEVTRVAASEYHDAQQPYDQDIQEILQARLYDSGVFRRSYMGSDEGWTDVKWSTHSWHAANPIAKVLPDVIPGGSSSIDYSIAWVILTATIERGGVNVTRISVRAESGGGAVRGSVVAAARAAAEALATELIAAKQTALDARSH